MRTSRVVIGLLAGCSMIMATGTFAQQQPGHTGQGAVAPQGSPSSAAPAGTPQSPSSTVQGVLLSTDSLLGSNVRNPEGKEIGRLNQMMIDPHTGRVMYGVVAMGGFLGMGERTVVVPWNAVVLTRDGNRVVLSLPQYVLQPMAEAPAGAAAPPPASEVRGSGGWGVDGPYGRLYDPAREQTVSGQVVRLESAAPAPNMAPGMQMTVQADDGRTLRVLVGPDWYLSRQDVEIPENARVQVVGVPAELNGQPVFVAREVQFGGQTLMLRDAQGVPVWSSLRRSASAQ